MIDTIVLMLNQDEFQITDHDRFSPSTIGLFKPPYYMLGGHAFIKCSQNPTKQELEAGTYKPRLTVIKRMRKGGFIINLRIEFSAPKLLYGNNFAEVKESDFSIIIQTLRKKLQEMDVIATTHFLSKARVASIHYSKNIILEDYISSSMIISELSKINLNKRLDLSNTNFRNAGHALHYHTNSFDIVFYDKIKDMEQSKISEKRALETDNNIQLSLFEDYKILQVLRYEVRLGTGKKITADLKRLNITANSTFAELFKARLSKRLLLHYWQKIIADLPLLAIKDKKPEELFNKIMASNKDLNATKAINHIGILSLIDSVGVRGFRSLIEKHCSKRTWQRINKEMKALKLPEGYKCFAVSFIDAVLKDFKSITQADYEKAKSCLLKHVNHCKV